jgi:hypothetical protein
LLHGFVLPASAAITRPERGEPNQDIPIMIVLGLLEKATQPLAFGPGAMLAGKGC